MSIYDVRDSGFLFMVKSANNTQLSISS